MTTRVAIPSSGRLRDVVIDLLTSAGYPVGRASEGARTVTDDIEFIEMRSRDAAAWVAASRIDAAFVSTDLVLEEGLERLSSVELGAVRSDLVVASRDDDGRNRPEDLRGAVVATHLPKITERWFREQSIDATIVSMGGSLEGVCAARLADAIVDLRQTGTSLAQNRLRVLGTIAACQALLVFREEPSLLDLKLRLEAVLVARRHRYVMLHLHPDNVGGLKTLFAGLESPTVLPLAERDDRVAVHFVCQATELWSRLSDLDALGASGIVAVVPDALVR